jgi:hypothetical protein
MNRLLFGKILVVLASPILQSKILLLRPVFLIGNILKAGQLIQGVIHSWSTGSVSIMLAEMILACSHVLLQPDIHMQWK